MAARRKATAANTTHLKQMPKTSQQQPGADKQHEGESDLRGNQNARDSYLVLARSGAPAAFPEIACLVLAYALQAMAQSAVTKPIFVMDFSTA